MMNLKEEKNLPSKISEDIIALILEEKLGKVLDNQTTVFLMNLFSVTD